MAADAAWQCLRELPDRQAPSALYFASTSAPYLERLNGSVVAAMCDMAAEGFVADFSDSLRAGTSALFAAVDRVVADRGRALVVAADTREAEPGSNEEAIFSDAAAAVARGADGVIAELIGRATRYEDFFESARRDRDDFVTLYDGKYSVDRSYARTCAA